MNTSPGPAARLFGARNRDRNRAHAHNDRDSDNFRKHPQHLQGDQLRVAYKAQTSNKSNNNNNGFHHNNHTSNNNNNNMFDNNDQHSISAGSAANSAATPSSVYMPSSVALSRDNMSDLSGVSGGTHRGSSSNNIPGQILDPKSLMRPWKQAYDLSNIPPECNENNGASSGRTGQTANGKDGQTNNTNTASIWVAENDVVEIFENLESSLGLNRLQMMGGMHKRIPIMVLLMDPSRQSYELMQIWVDPSIDSVRDMVQALQQKLPSKWKQAYDGLFQVRGTRFTQLINIIRLNKYDIQPHEMLVAKPWSMAAKVTIAIAGSAIRHLTRIGVITTDNDDSTCSDKERNRNRRQLRNDDAPLLLSQRAQDRAYFPESILDHHHAIQFITFSPSFESANGNPNTAANEEPVGTASPTGLSSLHNTTSKSASDSGYNDARSSLLKSSDNTGKRIPGLLKLGVRRVIAGPKSRRQKPSPSLSRRGHGSSNNNGSEEKQYLTTSRDSNENTTAQKNAKREQKLRYNSDSSCAPVGCFSKLNCLRSSSNETTAKTRKSDTFGNPPKTMTTSLSEEEEKLWLAYSMKPIDEDQSLANGSVISMSAPLLSRS